VIIIIRGNGSEVTPSYYAQPYPAPAYGESAYESVPITRRRYTVSKATDPQSMRDPAMPHRCLNMRQRRHATGRGASPLGMGTAGFAGRSGSAIRRRQESVAPTARRSPKTLRAAWIAGRPPLSCLRNSEWRDIWQGS
jgi:hypothetical protein